MTHKKTVILGASTNPSRYAYLAANMLQQAGVPFVPVGIKKGEVSGEKILDLRTTPPIPEVHTVTLYLGEKNQAEWYDYIISLHPKRVIFNPGTENEAFQELLTEEGIEATEACTLVMLRAKTF